MINQSITSAAYCRFFKDSLRGRDTSLFFFLTYRNLRSLTYHTSTQAYLFFLNSAREVYSLKLVSEIKENPCTHFKTLKLSRNPITLALPLSLFLFLLHLNIFSFYLPKNLFPPELVSSPILFPHYYLLI